jgi:hypothetical protein
MEWKYSGPLRNFRIEQWWVFVFYCSRSLWIDSWQENMKRELWRRRQSNLYLVVRSQLIKRVIALVLSEENDLKALPPSGSVVVVARGDANMEDL